MKMIAVFDVRWLFNSWRVVMVVALVVRLVCLFYGVWQDAVMEVAYTDIDYIVFTDAAKYMYQGLSPYQRATYRYTPFLAFLLQGNVVLGSMFGKLLFVSFDILAGYLIYKNVELMSGSKATAISSACVWLFNPLTVVVSTRGNAESLMAVLVVALLYLLKLGKLWHLLIGAILYGFSVHMKIYPAIYSVTLFMYINHKATKEKKNFTEQNWVRHCINCLMPTWNGFIFGVVAMLSFLLATVLCYLWYGDEFLQHTYLYHVTRRDIRHNFSAYFYLLYLTSVKNDSAVLLSLIAFLPQMLLILLIALKMHRDVEFACFLQTFVFVTFNKVCTSQYFLWYLSLLPFIWKHARQISIRKLLSLSMLWLFGQAVWLLFGYLLEFHGYNVYLYIWLAGLTFFCINSYILYYLMMNAPKSA